MTEQLFYGTVKFYNAGAGDVFIGRSGAGLHAGDAVSFEIDIGHDGRQRAINVTVIRASGGGGNGAATERERVWRHEEIV